MHRALIASAAWPLLLGLTASRPAAEGAGPSPVGYWKTIDDKTSKPRSIIKIWEQDGELRGRVERIFPAPGDEPDPLCDKCKGDKHNQKIRGMEMLWGFKRKTGGFTDGRVLDPEEGRTYHAQLEILDGGARLRLFGYVRIIFKIGRSQTWERVKPEEYGL